MYNSKNLHTRPVGNAFFFALLTMVNTGRAEWTGPSLTIQRFGDSKIPGMVINGDTRNPVPPLWLTLHLQVNVRFFNIIQHLFLLALIDIQIDQAIESGLRVICICLTSDDVHPPGTENSSPWLSHEFPLDNRTKAMLDRVVDYHPEVLFVIRFYAEIPGAEPIVMLNLSDSDPTTLNNKSNDAQLEMNALTLSWEQTATEKLKTMLTYMDNIYPGKIAGVFPCFLHTSEWFFPGPNDAGSGPNSKLSDYSAGARERFCSDQGDPKCHFPLPSERIKPAFGAHFSDVSTNQLNLFYSKCAVSAIRALAVAAKNVSGGKLLTASFYGYLFALADDRYAGSGHLAFAELLRVAELDVVASPYQYSALVRNNSLGSFLPHGPWDSPAIHGKTWIVEDDSRTTFAFEPSASIPQRLTFCEDASACHNLLKRNVMTSLLHGNGAYFYDLACTGWFGRPDKQMATEAIWSGITSGYKPFYKNLVAQLFVEQAPGMTSQIAVFVDDLSASTWISLDDGGFTSSLVQEPPIFLSAGGAPIKTFLLSDLLQQGLDWSQYRMCVFLNAFVISPEVSAAINSKLKLGGKTLVWTYGSGLFQSIDDPREVNMSLLSETVGMQLLRGDGAIPLFTHVPQSASLSTGFPRNYGNPTHPLDPWFFANVSAVSPDSPSVEVLGILVNSTAQKAGLVRISRASYTSVFSSSPGLPRQLWAALARSAGVHVYLDDENCQSDMSWEVGDSVEVRGRFIMVHASATCSTSPKVRHIQLPFRATILDEASVVLCSNCTSFATATMSSGDVYLYQIKS